MDVDQFVVMKEYVVAGCKIDIEKNIFLNEAWKKFIVHKDRRFRDVLFKIFMKNPASRHYGIYRGELEEADSYMIGK